MRAYEDSSKLKQEGTHLLVRTSSPDRYKLFFTCVRDRSGKGRFDLDPGERDGCTAFSLLDQIDRSIDRHFLVVLHCTHTHTCSPSFTWWQLYSGA